MNIIQRPDTYSLTSTIKDFIIESDWVSSTNSYKDILFEVLLNGNSILKESYVPDASGKIYVRDLGGFLENYLSGSLAKGKQDISKEFSFKIDNQVVGSSTVLFCKATTGEAANLFYGKRLLNLQYLNKITIPGSKEYISVFSSVEGKPIQARVIYKKNNSLRYSETKPVYINNYASGFYTYDVSFSKILSNFPEIEQRNIVAYMIIYSDVAVEYKVDWETYLDPKFFIYLNSFGVPESIVCRGETFRKGVQTFETSKINKLEHKYNIQRADTFEVSSGKIYSHTDYLLLREMFSSEDVRCFFNGKYRKIIITEENSNISYRSSSFTPVKFTFRFADSKENISLLDSFTWILENGTWNDKGLWYDSGQWNDKPQNN